MISGFVSSQLSFILSPQHSQLDMAVNRDDHHPSPCVGVVGVQCPVSSPDSYGDKNAAATV